MAKEVISWKGREPVLVFTHLTGPAWYGATLQLYPPDSGTAWDAMPSRKSPRGRGHRTRGRIHPADKRALGLLWREGGWLLPQRARAAARERRGGDRGGGTPALSHESSCISSCRLVKASPKEGKPHGESRSIWPSAQTHRKRLPRGHSRD